MTIPAPALVCGAGQMGHGIAQVIAAAGIDVRLYEPDLARAIAGRERIATALDRAVARGRLATAERDATLARIVPMSDLATAASGAAIALEAIVEDETAKRALVASLDAALAPGVVIASNTSSIPIGRLAAAASPARRPLVIGLHFFGPVPAMPLVEIVRAVETGDAAEAAARALAEAAGKTPIVAQDRPGFIVNRMLMPFLAEAMRLLEEGTGSAEAIDAGARLGLNHPMGPLALADLIGLDTLLAIMEIQAEGLAAPYHAPPAILRRLVAEGRLGRKSGRGFFDYPSA